MITNNSNQNRVMRILIRRVIVMSKRTLMSKLQNMKPLRNKNQIQVLIRNKLKMIKSNNLFLSLNSSNSSSSSSSNNLDLMLRKTSNSMLLNSNSNNSSNSSNNRNLLNKQQHSKNLAITIITNSKRRVHQFQDHRKKS